MMTQYLIFEDEDTPAGTYTVIIPNLTLEEAEYLAGQYSGVDIKGEGE